MLLLIVLTLIVSSIISHTISYVSRFVNSHTVNIVNKFLLFCIQRQSCDVYDEVKNIFLLIINFI